MKSGNDTGSDSKEKETKGKNERTGEKKGSEDKNETLKGRTGSGRNRTEKKTKTEVSSRFVP